MVKERPRSKIIRLNQTILGGFLAVAAALLFWGVVRSGAMLAREDNPRLVEAALRIERGHIVDRNGVILAENAGPPERLQRIYPFPQVGPAVGYYSFRHGTTGVEESFDNLLRQGEIDVVDDWVRQILHRPLSGWNVRLTLDAVWQETADSLLPAQPAALLLLEIPHPSDVANILALVSHPGYDPNQLDDQFEAMTQDESAPLLNRVTQGQYQPGLTLQPFILASALEDQQISLNETLENVQQAVLVNGITISCLTPPLESMSWTDILPYACPAPMQQLADQLGRTGLDKIFNQFQLTEPPNLPLDTETAESQPITDPLLAGIGQDTLTITPLQLGLAWAALAGNGRIPQPRLVTAVQDEMGEWLNVTETGENPVAISEATAITIRQVLPRYENILEHTVLVLSGPEGSSHAWYLGMTPTIQPQYLVVVVIEKQEDITAVQTIGRSLLKLVVP